MRHREGQQVQGVGLDVDAAETGAAGAPPHSGVGSTEVPDAHGGRGDRNETGAAGAYLSIPHNNPLNT